MVCKQKGTCCSLVATQVPSAQHTCKKCICIYYNTFYTLMQVVCSTTNYLKGVYFLCNLLALLLIRLRYIGGHSKFFTLVRKVIYWTRWYRNITERRILTMDFSQDALRQKTKAYIAKYQTPKIALARAINASGVHFHFWLEGQRNLSIEKLQKISEVISE